MARFIIIYSKNPRYFGVFFYNALLYNYTHITFTHEENLTMNAFKSHQQNSWHADKNSVGFGAQNDKWDSVVVGP